MIPRGLVKKLSNIEYRRQFVSAQVRRTITSQMRKLRIQRNWDQAELGQQSGMKPHAISRLENPDYGNFTVNTLLRIANAFDVGLIVRFAPFSDLAKWNQSVTETDFTPPSFSDDRGLWPIKRENQGAFYRPSPLEREFRNAKALGVVPPVREAENPDVRTVYAGIASNPTNVKPGTQLEPPAVHPVSFTYLSQAAAFREDSRWPTQ